MKKELRKELTFLRDNLEERYSKSLIIKDKIMNLDIYKHSHNIAIYSSMRSDVDTKELIKESLERGMNVYLPKVINKKKMIFMLINKDTIYERNSYGVLEPVDGNISDNFDLIIIPGLAFDKDNNG